MKIKTVVLVLAILLVAATLLGNGIKHINNNRKPDNETIKSVVIGVPNWRSAMATAYILRELIKRDLAIETRLHSGTDTELYAGITDGTIHIHPEGRTPDHNKWHEHLSGKLERNKTGVTTTQGLCVNKTLAEQYNITHIKDLLNPGIANYFDTNGDGRGEIWIGNENENVSTTTIEKIRAKSYGYDTKYELLQMTEKEALQRLEKAATIGKLFAIHCYAPHWMHRTYELYQLKEPAHRTSRWNILSPAKDPQWLEKSNADTAWEPTRLHIYYTKTLKQQYPAIAQLLKKTQFTLSELEKITYDMKKGNQDLTTYARKWIAENR